LNRALRRTMWWALVVVLAGATVAAAMLGAWQLTVKDRLLPPVADQTAVRQVVLDAARADVVKVLTYHPETLQQDIDAATAVLTGNFLNYYRQFSNEIVKGEQTQTTTTATVVGAGIESLTGQHAAILVFVNKSATSKDNPTPVVTAAAVRVGMANVNGAWLIDRFDPI